MAANSADWCEPALVGWASTPPAAITAPSVVVAFIGDEVVVEADYVVVGTGAGGAAAAVTLARGGATVVFVEAGQIGRAHV